MQGNQALQQISTHALREEGDHHRPDRRHLRRISTHALREEGDQRGRRRRKEYDRFLPTPSARRATLALTDAEGQSLFLPTPSARRATLAGSALLAGYGISTHALREEGDHTVL